MAPGADTRQEDRAATPPRARELVAGHALVEVTGIPASPGSKDRTARPRASAASPNRRAGRIWALMGRTRRARSPRRPEPCGSSSEAGTGVGVGDFTGG